MQKLSIKQRSAVELSKRVLLFQRTIKQWFYYAGLKYLQSHELSNIEEDFLNRITNYYIKYIDNITKDEDFLKSVKLQEIPKKKFTKVLK